MMIIMAIYVALGTPLMVGLGIGTSLQPLLFVLLVLVTTTTIFLAKNVAVYRQHSPDKEGGGFDINKSTTQSITMGLTRVPGSTPVSTPPFVLYFVSSSPATFPSSYSSAFYLPPTTTTDDPRKRPGFG